MEEKIKLTPWDGFYDDCKIPFNEFVEYVGYGAFTDDDGYGYYATEDGITDIKVYPSTVKQNWHKTGYPYVCWLNK